MARDSYGMRQNPAEHPMGERKVELLAQGLATKSILAVMSSEMEKLSRDNNSAIAESIAWKAIATASLAIAGRAE